MDNLEYVKPDEIEKRSFEILSGILGDRKFDPYQEPIIKRVIHTTADFDYADNLYFGNNAVNSALDALKSGKSLVTDTRMAWSGINKKALERLGGRAYCFMDDPEIAKEACSREITRASVCMEHAANNKDIGIYVVGNAPTALISIYNLIKDGKLKPDLIVAVPVGFVNVIESKELIMELNVPCIVARGRKGGSNVAAAIINALLYHKES